MLRFALCLVLLAVAAVAVRPPVVAACCTVERSGCCGPTRECCRVAPADDVAGAREAPAVEPDGAGALLRTVVGAASMPERAPDAAGCEHGPPASDVRSHLTLSSLRV